MRSTLSHFLSTAAVAVALALGAVGAVSLLTQPVGAQTSVTTTTTTAAVSASASANSVALTSVSGISVGSEIFLDREAMLVNSFSGVSGLTANVTRGYDGTLKAAHASGVTVYAGPTSGITGSPFVMSNPPLGTCSAAADFSYNFWINPVAGMIWKCVNSEWVTINDPFRQAVEVHGKLGAAIASAATIAPDSYATHVTGTTTINTITVPAGCSQTCQIVLVPDGLWSTGTAGNIYIATTGVVSKALILTWDGTKWSPSY